MPGSFYIIITVQALLLCLFVYVYRHKSPKLSIWHIAMWSIIAGGLFGIFFDMLCGAIGVHTYLPLNEKYSEAVCACGLDFWPLLINGALSYGIAMWTAYYIAHPTPLTKHGPVALLALLYLLIVGTSLFFLVNGKSGTLAILFAAGFVIAATGELFMLALRQAGPLSAPFITRDISALARMWVQVIGIGVIYETANYLFPFWVWFPSAQDVGFGTEITIIIFAYAGLFHPMIVCWQLLKSRNW